MCFKILVDNKWYFKMKYLSRAKNDFNSQKLLVGQEWSARVMFNLYSASLSTGQPVQDVQHRPSNCTQFSTANIYSSCDGLVLLGVVSHYRNQLILWNPSTRESTELVLPCSGFRLQEATFGLAYDTNSNDYRILKVNKDGQLQQSIEILTLKGGSWRSIYNNPTTIHPYRDEGLLMGPVVFVRGTFYWLGHSHNFSVVSFSTLNEVYRDIPLLDRIYRVVDPKQSSGYGISVLEGMFCFYSTHNYHWDRCTTFQLWGMKNYGVAESWTELFTLHAPDIDFARPKYRYADGEVLLCCRLDMARGGRGGDEFRTTKGKFGSLWPQSYFQNGIIYTEGLISPKLLI
ncbi:unnamed protein product [Withania somnifera]